jgi:hypothetical protein
MILLTGQEDLPAVWVKQLRNLGVFPAEVIQ